MNKPDKKIRILLLLILSFFLTASLSCSKNPDKPFPTIKKGILDVRGWDFLKDGKIELRGESEFYWKKVLTASDFYSPVKPKPDTYVSIPALWNTVKINEKEIGYIGYATYRFRVKTDRPVKELAFKTSEISSAYNFYIDNKKIASAGTFATSADKAKPARFWRVITFKPKKNEFNVIVHVSNFDAHLAGFYTKTYMGNPAGLRTYRAILLASEFFVFGSIFIMFFYHLGFHFFRRKDKSTLFFSLACLFLATYLLVSGELLFYEIFPNLPWGLVPRLMFITAYMSLGMASYYLNYIFEKESNIRIVHIGNIVCVTFTLISMVVSLETCMNLMIVFSFFMFAVFFYFLKVIIEAVKNKTEGSLIYIFGCAVLVPTIVNDLMHGFGMISSAFIASYGVLGFLFSQAMLLSRRFSHAYVTVENLSVDLEQKNIELSDFAQNLEKKVEERTEELKSANDTLLVMHQELVNASETANKDMAIAINVQASLFPKEVPTLKNWDIAFEFKPASGVSGDLYDFYINDGNIEGMNLSDVSGHGIASGLITMIARSAFFRNFSRYNDSPLNVVLENINKDLIGEIDNVDNYLTSILLRFNGNTVEYVNAGHTDLLRKSGSTGKVEIVDTEEKNIKGMYMGLSAMSGEYNTMAFNLENNDIIALYSDCIIESADPKGEQYGDERLIASFEKASNMSAKEILNTLISDMNNFTNNSELSDDLTVVVMKYLE